MPQIKNIYCGVNYTIAISESRQLFGWGNNKYGQLSGPTKKDYNSINNPKNYTNPIMIKVPG